MGKGRGSGSKKTQFKPGQSGNPNGGPKQDPAIKAFKETTYKDFIAGLQRYGFMTRSEMEAALNDPSMTHFELMFANIVASAAQGDKDARAVLLDRLWGKVKDTIDVAYRDLDQELEKVNRDKIVQLLREANSG